MTEPIKKKNSTWSWLLWWQIDQEELNAQVLNYKDLGIFKSARGQSALCLLLSIAITSAFVLFKAASVDAVGDAALMAILALFIYLGHRWAMISAMVLWTLEKGLYFAVYLNAVSNGTNGGATGVMQIFWWCLYMHAFYFAFRIEQLRKQRTPAAAA